MKNRIRHYGPVALLMAAILLASALLTLLAAPVPEGEGLTVVATTYPLYLAAKNAAQTVPGVTVYTLTGAASGCLHDYQLSPADRLRLQEADLVLLNGAGAEDFLAELIDSLPGRVVDTSAGIPLLESCHHHEEEDHHHEGGYNEHLWAGPQRYAAQVAAVNVALAEADPENKTAYAVAGEAYHRQVQAVSARLQAAVAALPAGTCITFHDSLAYLAADSGLTVALSLTVGEDAGVSAGDLSAAQKQLEQHPDTLLLYDAQYTVRYAALDELVSPDQVLALETGVTGEGHLTDWLDGMNKNAALLGRLGKEG